MMRPNGFMLIVLVIALCRGFTSSLTEGKLNTEDAPSSEATPRILESRSTQIGKQCLTLPKIGNPSVKTLIKQKCYVDKTAYLDQLMRVGEKFYFLSRPRRFGKTLLVDTLQELFKLGGDNKLFNDTEIHRRRDGVWSRYPTIRLDFSNGVVSTSVAAFNRTTLKLINDQARNHEIDLGAFQDIEVAIKELIYRLNKKYNNALVVILIDEYDNPYTSAYPDMETASGILCSMQSFYKTLKAQYETVHFNLVTGITRLALSDFFSGMNAATDLTMDPDYAGIVGFNKSELLQYFDDLINDVVRETGKKKEYILETMRCWHDGFQFCEKDESLYSPVSVFGYIRTKAVSTTSWSESGGPSKFLVEKLKEFPKNALEFFINEQNNFQADKKEDMEPPIRAPRRDLVGKNDFTKLDIQALTALLFHSGYFSIRKYDVKSDVFTLNFTNLELREDYILRISQSIKEIYEGDLDEKIKMMKRALDVRDWKNFTGTLDSYNANIPYQITVNQRKGLEAWFQFNLYLVLKFANYHRKISVGIEESTSMGRIDIVFDNGLGVYIFEPKMEDNPENPVYECKEKYVKKYLLDPEKLNVYCIGIKFTTEGHIHSWGVASFSYNGNLITEEGSIKLTNELSPEERKDIRVNVTNYRSENPECKLESERLSDFLEQLGPTMEGQLIFAENFFKNTPIKSLCSVLRNIKPLIEEPNIKGMIFSFLKAADIHEEYLKKEKPLDPCEYEFLYLQALRPVQKKLFKDENNDFKISFQNFVNFICKCEEPKDAPSIVSFYTEDIPNLLTLLNKSHPLVKEPLIKSRITRIQTALGGTGSKKKSNRSQHPK